jgi:hypothetical protein
MKSQKNIVSVVSHDVFFLLDFLTPEAGTNRLSRNVGKELPLGAVQYPRRVRISHDLVVQALVWLCMVRFRAIWFGTVRFSASHTNLGPHIFKCQI